MALSVVGSSPKLSQAGAVYWIGQDGNVWYKGTNGSVSNMGAAQGTSTTANLVLNGAKEIGDPNPGNASVQGAAQVGGGGGGGAAAAPDTSAADLAYLDDQEGRAKGMLSSTAKSLENGLLQLGDSVNKELDKNKQGRVSSAAKYGTQRNDTTEDKLDSVRGVKTNARTLADSVRRVLGMAAGRQSSAYQEVAPGAIARDASIKTTDVNDRYARNFRNIKTAEDETMAKYDESDNEVRDTAKQRESDLRAGILQQEQGIYGTLADIARQRESIKGGGYSAMRRASSAPEAAIGQRQAALDNLFTQFRTPFSAKAVTATEANLDNYNVDKTELATKGAGGGAASGEVSPYLQALKKRFQTA